MLIHFHTFWLPCFYSYTEWSEGTEGYEVTNENKTATRTSGLTRVLYSSFQSYESGHPISFRIMFTGEKSPVDGIAITLDNEDTETLKREGVVFVATDGLYILKTLFIEL